MGGGRQGRPPSGGFRIRARTFSCRSLDLEKSLKSGWFWQPSGQGRKQEQWTRHSSPFSAQPATRGSWCAAPRSSDRSSSARSAKAWSWLSPLQGGCCPPELRHRCWQPRARRLPLNPRLRMVKPFQPLQLPQRPLSRGRGRPQHRGRHCHPRHRPLPRSLLHAPSMCRRSAGLRFAHLLRNSPRCQ